MWVLRVANVNQQLCKYTVQYQRKWKNSGWWLSASHVKLETSVNEGVSTFQSTVHYGSETKGCSIQVHLMLLISSPVDPVYMSPSSILLPITQNGIKQTPNFPHILTYSSTHVQLNIIGIFKILIHCLRRFSSLPKEPGILPPRLPYSAALLVQRHCVV